MARINCGPAALCDLACDVHVKCSIPEGDMYRIAYTEVLALIKDKRIYRHDCGAFMLPPSTPVETAEPITPKLRPGTVVPRAYRHLVP